MVVPELSDDFLCLGGVWVVVVPPPPPETRFAPLLFLHGVQETGGGGRVVIVNRSRMGVLHSQGNVKKPLLIPEGIFQKYGKC